MRKGIFITGEGGEGAGKTTIIKKVYETLQEKGYEVILTREPGGIAISEKIRSVILDEAHVEMDGRTEALLYAAARRQHLIEKIIPALREGKIVLCDRFIDSSLAYQGFARGIGFDEILSINKFAIEDYMPDLTLLFHITPELGLQRIAKDKKREINRLDLEEVTFHDRVYEGYERLKSKYSERIVEIDASEELDTVFQKTMRIIEHKCL